MKTCKKLLAFPSAIKGAMSLYEKLKAGGARIRDIVADVFYITGDAIDGLVGFTTLGKIPISKLIVDRLSRFKDITAVFSLSNTTYNLITDLRKLKRIDISKTTHPEIQDVEKAVVYKTNWVHAEMNNKW